VQAWAAKMSKPKSFTATKTPQFPMRPGTRRVALVLQGGGALGAYQVGVFQALDEHGFTPDWVGGTSIGAINGAIIAGNPPGIRFERLKRFWNTIMQEDPFDLRQFPAVPSMWRVPSGAAVVSRSTCLAWSRRPRWTINESLPLRAVTVSGSWWWTTSGPWSRSRPSS
jgi:predicted acylesterase/phospholipase RssA